MRNTRGPRVSKLVKMRALTALLGFLFAIPVPAQLSNDPGAGPHARAQAAADFIRDAAKTPLAFLPAGLLKQPDPGGDLASLILYPTNEIVVVRLSGAEIREALERSLASYPSSSNAFLQISGATVIFSPSASRERATEVKIGDSLLEPSRQYEVAMPESLARGALGYFKIWDKSKIVRNVGKTLDEVLKGKTDIVRSPRYIAR